MVNGAVMIFERKHAFLQKCVDWIYTAWNYSKNPRDDWTIIGPRFLDYTWKWMVFCHSLSLSPSWIFDFLPHKICFQKARNQTGDMQVLPPHSFYPVFYKNTNVFESVWPLKKTIKFLFFHKIKLKLFHFRNSIQKMQNWLFGTWITLIVTVFICGTKCILLLNPHRELWFMKSCDSLVPWL